MNSFWITYEDVDEWYDGTIADFEAEFNYDQDSGEVKGAIYRQ